MPEFWVAAAAIAFNRYIYCCKSPLSAYSMIRNNLLPALTKLSTYLQMFLWRT